MAQRNPTAKQLPSGNWRVQVFAGKSPEGKNKYVSFTENTREEAEFKAYEFIMNRRTPTEKRTIGALMDEYIEMKSNILSPSTLRSYRSTRRNRFRSLMEIPLDKITPTKIQMAVNDAARIYAPRTVRCDYSFLTSVLAAYSNISLRGIKLPKIAKRSRDLPTPKDVFEAVRGSDIELPVMFGLWMGFRISEIAGFQKSDLRGDVITVNRVIVAGDDGDVIKETAKTDASKRSLRVPPYIMSLINQLPDDQEFLVPMNRNTITRKLHKRMEMFGLPSIKFHDLRHINASVMMTIGIPDKYAMERGGWNSDTIYKKIYAETFSSARMDADNTLDRWFEEHIFS